MVHDTRGHVGIAMLDPSPVNVGSVIRSAGCFDVDYVVVVDGSGYNTHTAVGHHRHVPVWNVGTETQFLDIIPKTKVICIDYDETATPLDSFSHPERALYVLGNESDGFERYPTVREEADSVVAIQSDYCLNVAVAGSMVMRDVYSTDGDGFTEVSA